MKTLALIGLLLLPLDADQGSEIVTAARRQIGVTTSYSQAGGWKPRPRGEYSI